MTRPPKEWYKNTMQRVKEKHPDFENDKISKIVGGLWYKKLTTNQRNQIKQMYG